MGHQHNNHKHDHGIQGRKLLYVTLLNIFITIAEIVGGLLANSLALLSDALHNFSDGVAVLLAYTANKISQKPSNERKTFGYKRIQILAAFFNAIVLIVISVYLFYEAYHRFLDPQPIKGLIMFVVALGGLLANLFAVLLLKKDSKKNLNVRAAYLHLLGDTLSSVAVIVGGILIYFFEIYWIDPLITVLIGLYIIRETWGILKETVDILMQATPRGLDLQIIKKDIESITGISNIHHLHAWNLDDNAIHFECHVDLEENLNLKETESIYNKIDQLLNQKHQITHITIQFEHKWCDEQEMIHK